MLTVLNATCKSIVNPHLQPSVMMIQGHCFLTTEVDVHSHWSVSGQAQKSLFPEPMIIRYILQCPRNSIALLLCGDSSGL